MPHVHVIIKRLKKEGKVKKIDHHDQDQKERNEIQGPKKRYIELSKKKVLKLKKKSTWDEKSSSFAAV